MKSSGTSLSRSSWTAASQRLDQYKATSTPTILLRTKTRSLPSSRLMTRSQLRFQDINVLYSRRDGPLARHPPLQPSAPMANRSKCQLMCPGGPLPDLGMSHRRQVHRQGFRLGVRFQKQSSKTRLTIIMPPKRYPHLNLMTMACHLA